jgi:dimethylargininase
VNRADTRRLFLNMDSSRTPRLKAIVRDVASTYDRCIRPHGGKSPIDVARARRQHNNYCATLVDLGFDLVRLDADDRYPDCCFVEDTAIVAGSVAVICEMGAPSRRGEQPAVAAALDGWEIVFLELPATMDGGDVLRDGNKLFVGLTERTNQAAVDQLSSVLARHGMAVEPVVVRDVLHLKSACTRLGPGLFLVSESFARTGAFAGFDLVVVPEEESYAANCFAASGQAIVSEGFPVTKSLIEDRGIVCHPLDMSEFRKGGGSLTCLSIPLL